MASRLLARRKQQPKKATVLVSSQTLEAAIQEAHALVEQLIAIDAKDGRLDQLEESISFLTSILKKSPMEMQQEGASSLDDYLDDAVMPDMAEKIKQDVDMIAKMKNAGSQTQEAPVMASGSDNWVTDEESKAASGSDNWVSDRVDGEPKKPELMEVPRLAGFKNADLFRVAAPVPVAPKAPKPSADITQLSSDTLAKIQKALAGSDDLKNDKAAQAFIVAIGEELMNRPVEQEEPVAAAPAAPAAPPIAAPATPTPIAASWDGLNLAAAEGEEEKTAADRRRDFFKEDMKKKQDAENENKKKDEKKTATAQGGSFVNDGDTGTIVEDGGRTPEVAKAHKELEDNTGIKRPATELPSKFASAKTAGDYDDPAYINMALTETGPLGALRRLLYRLDGSYNKPQILGLVEKELNSFEQEKSTTASKQAGDYDDPLSINLALTETGPLGALRRLLYKLDGSYNKPQILGLVEKELNEIEQSKTEKSPVTASKTAGDMTTTKAVKLIESTGDELKAIYLKTKPVQQVLDSRSVREAVESIYRAYDMMGEAAKVLNKQKMQEDAEAQATEVKNKNKKSSALGGLVLASEDDDDSKCEECGKPHSYAPGGQMSETCQACSKKMNKK